VEENFFLRPISHSDDACLFRVLFFCSFSLFATRPFVRFFLNHNNNFFVFFLPTKIFIPHNAKQNVTLSSSRTIISPSSAQFTNKRKSSSLNNNRRSNNNNGGFLQISAISAADVTGPVKETLGDLQSVEVRNFGNNSSLWSNSIILKKILSFFLCARGVGGGKRRVRSQRKNDLFSSSSSHSVLLASVWDRFVKESGREGAETPKGLTFFPSELFFLPRQLFFFATFFQFSRAVQKRI